MVQTPSSDTLLVWNLQKADLVAVSLTLRTPSNEECWMRRLAFCLNFRVGLEKVSRHPRSRTRFSADPVLHPDPGKCTAQCPPFGVNDENSVNSGGIQLGHIAGILAGEKHHSPRPIKGWAVVKAEETNKTRIQYIAMAQALRQLCCQTL